MAQTPSTTSAAQSKCTSAAGLFVAAAILCASRTSVSVFANLAAVTTKKHAAPECEALVHDSKGGVIPPAALVMLVEAAKFLIATLLWRLELRSAPQEQQLPDTEPLAAKAEEAAPSAPLLDRRFFLFAPLAALYCACNVLLLVALQRMAAPLYELVSTLRIPLSAALAWAFTASGALLRLHHYAALALLVAANLLAVLGGGDVASSVHPVDALLVFLSMACSTTANLVFELITKERFLSVSVHLQNVQLYSWGVLLNGLAFLAMEHAGGSLSLDWLPCANVWHACLVSGLACVGIVTGIVLKYHGNVASVVAQSFAVHLSALLSHLSMRFKPSWQFLAGAILCQMAILLYNRDALWPKRAAQPTAS